MKQVFLSLLILVVATSHLKTQTISEVVASKFIADILEKPADLDKWVLADELETSNRLGITYTGVFNKFLISYDISDEIRNLINKKSTAIESEIHGLAPGYSRLSLTFRGIDYNAEYYFMGDKLISPVYYYSRNWHRFESDYFIFFVSNKKLFNGYSAERLDSFVSNILEILDIPQNRRERLKEEKIYYFLCKDTNEIFDLTGFNTRGMYNLAFDYIISVYNCHYHEIVHLLINYKLQDLSLETHPFFQEGIAVALGGRGGKEPSILMDLGVFLVQSQIARYQDLLSHESFNKTNASLSYPVSGLYNAFLIDRLGIDEYLTLYRKYSGGKARAYVLESDLPENDLWISYLQTYSDVQTIDVSLRNGIVCDLIYSDSLAEICQYSTEVRFKIRAPVLLSEKEAPDGFICRIIQELFPKCIYKGEKYLVTANEHEVSVYNLYTNNLVAKYIPSMSVQMLPVVAEEGFYSFSIDKSVFDDDLRKMKIRVIRTVQ